MKRKIAILMSAIMVAGAMPMSASAAAFEKGKIVAQAFSKANNPIDANALTSRDANMTIEDLEGRQSMLTMDLDEKDITGTIEAGTTFNISLENGTFDKKYEANYEYLNSFNGTTLYLENGTGTNVSDYLNSLMTQYETGNIGTMPTDVNASGAYTKNAPIAGMKIELAEGLRNVQAHLADSNNYSSETVKNLPGGVPDITLDNSVAKFIELYNAINGTNETYNTILDSLKESYYLYNNQGSENVVKPYIPYEFKIVSPTEAQVVIKADIRNEDKSVILSGSSKKDTITDFHLLDNSDTAVTQFNVANIKTITKLAFEGTAAAKSDISVSPYLAIPLGGVVADTDGPVKISVKGDYTEKIKAGDFNLTKNEDGSTNFDYPEKNIKYFEDYTTLEPVVIKENSRLTIGKSNSQNISTHISKDAATVTLRLNSGFQFKNTAQDIENNLVVFNDADATATPITPGSSNVKVIGNGSAIVVELNGLSGSTFSDRKNPIGLRFAMQRTTSTGTVYEGLQVEPTSNGQFGEVVMTVSGDGISTQTKTVAKRESFGFDLKTKKDPETIIAGRHYFPNHYNDKTSSSPAQDTRTGTMIEGDNTTVEIQFSEKIPNTLVKSRALDFTVPDGVKIVDAYVDYNSVRYIDGLDDSDFEIINNGKTLRLKRNTYEVVDGTNVNNLASFRFKLDLSVDPSFSGDIKLGVTGGGQSDTTEAIVAKAIAPFTIETATTKLNMGYQDYNTADITITEAKPGMFLANKEATLSLRAPFKGDVEIGFSNAELEVTGKELNIKPVDFKVKDGVIRFTIDRASYKEPASVKIKNVKVGTTRSVPYGTYDLALAGEAVINNYNDTVRDEASFNINQPASDKHQALYDQSNTDHFKFEKYVDLVTETGTFDKTVKVTVGEKTVLVGDQAVDMDVAPYIQASSNSTMVPLRFVSVALGVDSENVANPDNSSKIAWDANTKTTTIYYGAGTGQKIIQFQAGSNIMTVDGTRIPMEYGVKAEIKDGRMFVPFRALGQALGVAVDWDADTRTAVYNKDYARNTNVTTTAATTTETTTESTTASSTTTETTTESTTASDSTTETTTAK